MSEHSPTATRRTALGFGIGVLSVSVVGCDVQDLDPRTPLPAPGSGEDAAPQTPDPDSDVLLVAEVVALIAARSAQVDVVRQRYRGLRRELAPLVGMHAAHLGVLDPDDAAPRVESTALAATNRAKARRRTLQTERTLQQQLARAAERAEAGQLAKLLASISASIAQRLAAIEEQPS